MARRLIRTAVATIAIALAGCAGHAAKPAGANALAGLETHAAQDYAAGRYPQAQAAYQQLVEAIPKDPQLWFRLGNVQTRMQQLDAAADAYLHVLALAPHDAKAMHNLGVVRLRQAEAAFAQSAGNAGEAQPALRVRSARMADGIARLAEPQDTATTTEASP
jgi:tetratricopeptide (TPR) repeat protein